MAMNQPLTRFVVWAPDYTDEGASKRRLAVRASHLDNIRESLKKGIVPFGGAFLSSDSANADPGDRKIIGSCFVIEAKDLGTARELVESDVYYTNNVWDKEKLQILPIMLATPLPSAGASA